MKHLMNLGKAFLAAGVVLTSADKLGSKLPAGMAIKGYDLRPIVAGGGGLFAVITVAGMLGKTGKKVGKAVVPTPAG